MSIARYRPPRRHLVLWWWFGPYVVVVVIYLVAVLLLMRQGHDPVIALGVPAAVSAVAITAVGTRRRRA